MEQAVLNLPPARLKVKNTENHWLIWDIIRKKYLTLTSEEWVRQHFVHYLINNKSVASNRILIERKVHTAQKRSRFDIAVTADAENFSIIIECKSSEIELNEEAAYQMQRYAYELKPEFLVLTNGLQHLIFQWNILESNYHQIKNLPENL